MRSTSIFLALAALAAAPAAHAGVSETFAGCDGLMKPKSKDDGMRGTASQPGYGFSTGDGMSEAQKTVASCDLALTSDKLLPTQTVRRAHLLRARAAAWLRLGEQDKALADLDAADAAVADKRGEQFFDRSLGASLDLLRALALAQKGDTTAALPPAEKAAALRPYALPIQLAAAMVVDAARSPAPGGASPWEALVRLEPHTAGTMVSREVQLGNFAAAARFARHAPLTLPGTEQATGLEVISALSRRSDMALATASAALDLSFAFAATGDPKAARAQLELARSGLALLTGGPVIPGAVSAGVSTAPGSDLAGKLAAAVDTIFGARIRLAEARIALAEGRVDEARRMTLGRMPISEASVELLEALAAADDGAPPAALAGMRQALKEAQAPAGKTLGALADTLLIAYETPRSVIDYQKSRPNILGALVGAAFSMGTTLLSGIPKTAGFKETPNADGSVTIEYTGSTPSAPMVQEMTLLRAAELARAAGKPGFAIAARKDYTRYLTQTQYGVTISRTATGHKTELTIRMLDTPEAARERGFETVAVIDRLGPLYYETN